MALPSNVGHGTVTGKFLDSTGAALTGKITFTPQFTAARNTTAEPPATLLPRAVTVALPEEPATGTLPATDLVATDDPDLNLETGWTYQVSFAFTGAGAPRYNSFHINIPEGETVDLTLVAPVASSGGVQIVQGPGVPEGGVTGQVLAKNSPINFDTEWIDPPEGGGGGGGEPLTSYVDQVESLDDYPDTFPAASHTHSIANVTGLQTALDDLGNELDGKLDAEHSHTISDVTGLQSALDGKQAAGDYVSDAELSSAIGDLDIPETPGDIGAAAASHTHSIANVTGLQAALDGKVSGTNITDIVALSQAEYDGLGTKDPNTFYVITE